MNETCRKSVGTCTFVMESFGLGYLISFRFSRVDAASIHVHVSLERNHPARDSAASQLHKADNFVDVSELLQDLNLVRESEAYGDVQAPQSDAEDRAVAVEEYVSSVRELIATQE